MPASRSASITTNLSLGSSGGASGSAPDLSDGLEQAKARTCPIAGTAAGDRRGRPGAGFAALLVTARHGVTEWPFVAAFGLLIAFGEMVQFKVDRSRNRAPIAPARRRSGNAMLRGPSLQVSPDVAQVIAVTSIATMIGVAPRAIAELRWDIVVIETGGGALGGPCAAAVFSAVIPDDLAWNGSWRHAIHWCGADAARVLTAGRLWTHWSERGRPPSSTQAVSRNRCATSCW